MKRCRAVDIPRGVVKRMAVEALRIGRAFPPGSTWPTPRGRVRKHAAGWATDAATRKTSPPADLGRPPSRLEYSWSGAPFQAKSPILHLPPGATGGAGQGDEREHASTKGN